MSSTPNPENITAKEFTDVLARYPATIAAVSAANSIPKPVGLNFPLGVDGTLMDLDAWRLNTIPRTVESREKPFLVKDEAQMLLACKMRRGKRRAALPKLLAENPPELIQSATASAFSRLTASPSSTETILAALKVLVDAIKGVGPATASYILAAMAPASVPLFSDEGYRWVLYTNNGKGNDGWSRKIKYDMKEYRVYLDSARALAERLDNGVTAQDIEKVGFVLGKEAAEFTTDSESPAAAKARIIASKKLIGAQALDAALGVEKNSVASAGAHAIGLGTVGGSESNLVAQTRTAKAPTVRKRKKGPDAPDNDGDPDDMPPPPRSRKARVTPRRGGKKMGWVFTGKK